VICGARRMGTHRRARARDLRQVWGRAGRAPSHCRDRPDGRWRTLTTICRRRLDRSSPGFPPPRSRRLSTARRKPFRRCVVAQGCTAQSRLQAMIIAPGRLALQQDGKRRKSATRSGLSLPNMVCGMPLAASRRPVRRTMPACLEPETGAGLPLTGGHPLDAGSNKGSKPNASAACASGVVSCLSVWFVRSRSNGLRTTQSRIDKYLSHRLTRTGSVLHLPSRHLDWTSEPGRDRLADAGPANTEHG
jgi:hypothetical protein